MLESAPELTPTPTVNVPDPADADLPQNAPPPVLPVERAGALIEVVLCSGLPTQILILSALTGFGMPTRTDSGELSTRFVAAMSLIDMAVILGLVWLFLRSHGESVREFVLGRRRFFRECLLGIALIPATFMIAVLVLFVVLTLKPELHNVAVNPFESMLRTPHEAAVFALVAVFAGGLREEIQRAFIIRRFDQYLGGGLAGIAIYSLFFGVAHLEQGYSAVIATGVLGATWGLVYWMRGSVVAPIVSHAGFNLAQLAKYFALGAAA